MRDVLVTAIVFGVLPFVLARSSVGILLWSWISYMNPHRLTWSFAYSLPFAQIVAIVLIISFFTSKERKWFPIDGTLVVWLVFIGWMSLTTFFAVNSEWALEYYSRAIKIQFLTLLTIACLTDLKKLEQLIWVVCLSIGFFSIKGGVFTLVSGGGFRVYGPPDSFIEENNALAVATLMVVPLMWYLRSIVFSQFLKHGLSIAIILSLVSVLGSQSRGALVAVSALGLYFWFQSKSKIAIAIFLLVVGFGVISLMPGSWAERMESIKNYQEDASAMSRIDAWKFSINIANARLTGGGFSPFNKYTYSVYNPDASGVFVAHSIYFSVLACHGWVGLTLFLLILGLTWRSLNVTIKSGMDEGIVKVSLLARCLKLSLIAYMSGGAFLSLAYFDLPWHLVAIAYLLKHIVRSQKGQDYAKSTKIIQAS